ncbi:MAG: undecaprenyl diphosphate synthase family protein [Armatimonadetes bacterium]|nr:undecaprenyl diphosphate synthase family protein [Armatimonadota bacterium]
MSSVDSIYKTRYCRRIFHYERLWETAYSEIYVTPTCWPDFDRAHLIAAIADYQRRIRKFGAVVE